jgi:hypothetical protein
MRRWTIGMLVASALGVTACGSTSSGATMPRPPAPVNLTVFIDNSSVSVSPSSVGAGPVTFIITNQATQAESLAILSSRSSDGKSLADTGPINPQATAQVTVNFSSQGAYSLSTGDGGTGSGVRPASIQVGPPRASSDTQVLQP